MMGLVPEPGKRGAYLAWKVSVFSCTPTCQWRNDPVWLDGILRHEVGHILTHLGQMWAIDFPLRALSLAVFFGSWCEMRY